MNVRAEARHELVRELYDAAVSLAPTERRAFVDGRTLEDESIRQEVLTLLRARDDTGFLEDPLVAAPPIPLPSLDASSGTRIGHYRVLREIGRGGMGVVYLAARSDDVFHKVVALKVIAAGLNGELVERFKKERQILAGLDHPNIARILDGGDTPDGRPFYVMEYVSGDPIDTYCKRVDADIQARLRLVTDVCGAVDYLHDHAIVHRDLKPNNILVTGEGQVKLLDFGIAKVQTVEGLLPAEDRRTMLMTPGYASPEQVRGQEVTKRSDIYSLGAILYELLTGRLPYATRDGAPDLGAQLSAADVVPPSTVIAERELRSGKGATTARRFTCDLDHVVLMALQRDPSRRQPTVRMLGEELTRVIEGRPLQLKGQTWLYGLGHLVGRNRVAAILAVLFAVALAVSGGLAVQAYVNRVRLDATQAEVDRLVAMLNKRVELWVAPGVVPIVEKVADVETANQILQSKALDRLVAAGASPVRVNGTVGGIRHFLDRADELSKDEPPVRKSIAVTYRSVGDFEAKSPIGRPSETKRQAVGSYQRAATIAASVGPADRAWVESQLAELSSLVNRFGEVLAVTLPEAAPEAEPEPEAVPVAAPRKVQRRVAPPAAASPAPMTPELERAVEQVRFSTQQVEQARRAVGELRQRLQAQGQVLRPEISTDLSQAEAFLEEARRGVAGRDVAAAEESLGRVTYMLRRVNQAVGR